MENIPEVLQGPMVDFILSVDVRKSGSGVEYLGHNAFGIYDYPLAEQWLREQNHWTTDQYRLGDGTYQVVSFQDPRGSVEFKLMWGRKVVKKNAR
jgi:hypothetical protein